ncbi:MAG: Asp-tRNA(Asn)/Glu-tRNA(Gln) amidotransferase subunit GatC [Holosporales bacterium]|nr:Asp-tRNA(Asn)/Glu-tRNA(Gln) amidotransferase subunit GatC [Thalassospira sp.]
MALSTDTVSNVARLSRLAITPERLPALAAELNNILGFIEQLSAVNTEGVEPLRSVSAATLRLREDAATDGNQAEAVTANAPEKSHGFFVVPKVVE